MKTPACKQCPFKEGATYGYDADALEALRDDNEPACHMIAGNQAIFHEIFPDEKLICKGYVAYMNGEHGFCEPKLSQGA